MAKYREKPVVVKVVVKAAIEAVVWTGENFLEINEFTAGNATIVDVGLKIDSSHGPFYPDVADFLIKMADGTLYRLEPDEFTAIYDAVEDQRKKYVSFHCWRWYFEILIRAEAKSGYGPGALVYFSYNNIDETRVLALPFVSVMWFDPREKSGYYGMDN